MDSRKGVNPMLFIIVLLLMIIAASVVLNGGRHKAAVTRRAARSRAFREQKAGEASRMHTAYNRKHLKTLRKEVGFVESAKIAHAEYKGTN
jgi:hypothetical protein